MRWFARRPDARPTVPVPPEGIGSEEEKQWRLSLLSREERQAFEWFRRGYTARWTAETMFLGRRSARKLFGSVFFKLGAADEAEVSRLYRTAVLTPEELREEGSASIDGK